MNRVAGFAASLSVAAMAIVTSGSNAWAEYYPKRPLYDYRLYDPTDPACREAQSSGSQRCGPVTEPVFGLLPEHAELRGRAAIYYGRRQAAENTYVRRRAAYGAREHTPPPCPQ
jgi:hypothetical protein